MRKRESKTITFFSFAKKEDTESTFAADARPSQAETERMKSEFRNTFCIIIIIIIIMRENEAQSKG